MQGERAVAFPIVQRVDPNNPDSPTRDTGTVQVWFWCPGCDEAHAVRVGGEHPGPKWSWNNSLDRPTFQPSLLVNGREEVRNPAVPRCHSFITDGRIQFLGDCTHALANQWLAIDCCSTGSRCVGQLMGAMCSRFRAAPMRAGVDTR